MKNEYASVNVLSLKGSAKVKGVIIIINKILITAAVTCWTTMLQEFMLRALYTLMYLILPIPNMAGILLPLTYRDN